MKKILLALALLTSMGTVCTAFAYPDPVCTTKIERHEVTKGVFKMCCLDSNGVVWCPPQNN